MSDEVYVEKIDNVHVKIHAEPSIRMELSTHFEFYVPGYKFMPLYQNGLWDGKIRLLNVMTGLVYSGLLKEIYKFCKSRSYPFKIDPELIPNESFSESIGYDLAKEFKAPYTPRDYQNKAIYKALNSNRSLMLSPTASGKSFIIYLISRYYVDKRNLNVLIIVPTLSLISQMKGDFIEYNNGNDLDIHCIKSGADKTVNAAYTISTWQSLAKLDKKFFKKYDVVFVDEAHLAKSKSITKIMEKCPDIKYRYGLTGTLDDSLTHELTLTGLFGPVHRIVKTKDLIQNKTLSKFEIKGIIFEYNDISRKHVSKLNYADEIDWLVRHEKRNAYIYNLATNLNGNTLILYQFVEKHGKVLESIFAKTDIPFHFIHGGIVGDERERIRKLVQASDKNIILASFGTFSTGINIPNLDNLILASPSKSKIRTLQSIGRILRKSNDTNTATLFDLADDLRWKSKENYSSKHFRERIKIYTNESFDYKLYNIKLEK